MMFRRQILQKTVAAVVGAAGLSTAATASSYGGITRGGGREDEPTEDIHAKSVYFVPWATNDRVTAGDWIQHTAGLTAREDSNTRERLEEIMSTVEVTIEFEEVDEPEQYFSEPYIDEDGRWSTRWDYYTPPKPPGEYQIAISVETDSVQNKYEVKREY